MSPKGYTYLYISISHLKPQMQSKHIFCTSFYTPNAASSLRICSPVSQSCMLLQLSFLSPLCNFTFLATQNSHEDHCPFLNSILQPSLALLYNITYLFVQMCLSRICTENILQDLYLTSTQEMVPSASSSWF